MIEYSFYCVKCDRGHNKITPFCLSPECHGRMAQRDAYIRYLRRYRPDTILTDRDYLIVRYAGTFPANNNHKIVTSSLASPHYATRADGSHIDMVITMGI